MRICADKSVSSLLVAILVLLLVSISALISVSVWAWVSVLAFMVPEALLLKYTLSSVIISSPKRQKLKYAVVVDGIFYIHSKK